MSEKQITGGEVPPVQGRDVKCVQSSTFCRMDIGTILGEKFERDDITLLGGEQKGRDAIGVLVIGVEVIFLQKAHEYADMATQDGVMDEVSFAAVGEMQIGTVLDKKIDDGVVAVSGGGDQGCDGCLFVSLVEVGALAEKFLDGIEVTVAAGIEEFLVQGSHGGGVVKRGRRGIGCGKVDERRVRLW